MKSSEIDDHLRQAQRALDHLVRLLREVPEQFDREAAVHRIHCLSENVLCVLETTVENQVHYDAAFVALQQADELQHQLQGVATGGSAALATATSQLDALRQILIPVADELSMLLVKNRMHLRGVQDALPVRPFRTSRGVPELHAPRRGNLFPAVDIAPVVEPPQEKKPPIKKPATIEELLAMAEALAKGEPLDAGEAGHEQDSPDEGAPELSEPLLAYLPAVGERQMMRDLARDALEDIAGFRTLRHPIPTETWLDQAPFEQRLLNQIDYFVSLGFHALQEVSAFHAASEVPDPDRAFAVALALNCIEGADTAYTSVAILRDSPPEEMPGYAEGFQLAPNPYVDRALADLLRLDNADFGRVALQAMGRRGTLNDDDLARAVGHQQLAVQLEGARALAQVGHVNIVSQLLDPWLNSADDALFETAARTLLLRGEGYVRDLLRSLLHRGEASEARREAAFELLCMTGHSDDTNLLIEQLTARVTPRRLRALGRHGAPNAWSWITPQLAADDEALSEAAAEALMRITGAPEMWEDGEVPWVEDPPPEAYEQGVPIPARKVRLVVKDRQRWESWFDRNAKRFDPKLRYRGGDPFALRHLVDELEYGTTPVDRRWETAEELQFALGEPVRFFCDDWVERQKQRLRELRSTLPSAGEPGRWVFALSAKRAWLA